MKRLVLVLALVFVAATLSAGDGKHCDVNKKASAKAVELTGTVVCADGDCEKATFRVSNSDESYDVCHKSKASLKTLGSEGKVVRVKGKLVSCSEGEGTELMIESVNRV
jgi:RNase P/RNase MRP subunit p29